MSILKKIFDWMFVIGIIFMIGRIITFICIKVLNLPFTTFFIDLNPYPIILLIVGAIGSSMLKDRK